MWTALLSRGERLERTFLKIHILGAKKKVVTQFSLNEFWEHFCFAYFPPDTLLASISRQILVKYFLLSHLLLYTCPFGSSFLIQSNALLILFLSLQYFPNVLFASCFLFLLLFHSYSGRFCITSFADLWVTMKYGTERTVRVWVFLSFYLSFCHLHNFFSSSFRSCIRKRTQTQGLSSGW